MNRSISQTIVTSELIIPPLPDDSSLVLHKREFDFIDCKPQLSSFEQAVLTGLAALPKYLEPKFFYNEEGSRLFERICEAPEYYPTRTEMAILESHADEIKEQVGDNAVLIEFGSGNSQKIRLLLDNLKFAAYLAIEISCEQLLVACHELGALYPRLPIIAICADYTLPLHLPVIDSAGNGRQVAFFPGSTIGNFTPESALQFLVNIRQAVGTNGGLLIGVDMKKDKEVLDAAYNDKAGVTAAFNLNLLHRINRELGADFDLASFKHHAFYNEAMGRVEMHLASKRKQRVTIKDQTFWFEEGEPIHTENSYKYTVDEFRSLARQAGFVGGKVWVDKDQLFSVHYLNAV